MLGISKYFFFGRLMEAMDNIKNRLEEQSKQITGLQHSIVRLQADVRHGKRSSLSDFNVLSLVVLCASILLNGLVLWILSKKS